MNNNTSAETGKPRSLNWRAFGDAALIIIVLVAVKQFFLLYTIKYAGPISTFTAMAFATWRLRAAGMSWAELGFRKPDNILKTLLLSGGVFAAIVLAGAVGSEIAELFFDRAYVADRFGDLKGDVPMFAVWLVLIWTHGSFFEEMLFRAFIINRFESFLGGEMWATALSVALAAVFFGYRHAYYQGPFGFVVTGVIGLMLGIIYVWFGKNNLWPQILAHGYMNTISFTMRFLGLRA
ncbi:CPBP family intramembrane glutamic endopeptidase [Kordiimonas aquimaris]|uniref:CPBP family intramembrane glutamic endopeptidase n=1 Tax=Kordiimonas aquimaris TaxID=707591 RepID=UPI0021D379E8|nr:CPBP family intramembrane glutamic endopeptidase [Kordiimonas aquimaris]